MLAAVLTLFLVFSFSGVAVLNLSSFTSMENQNAVQNMKNQYAVESAVNVALWKVNTVVDTASSYIEDGVSVYYDSTTMEMVASIDRYDKNYTVTLDLSEDNHFNRGIAAEDSIIWNGHSAGLSEDKTYRKFNFLPEADLDYYMNNATAIHSDNFHSFENDTLSGIHVFTGSFISLKNIVCTGTLVFTGRYVWFLGGNNITAPADENNSYAAMVFTHGSQTTSLDNETVNGPIYAKNKVRIYDGANISGPVVAKTVDLRADIDMSDEQHPQYYKWNQGFGDYSNYTWPKNIGHWKVTAS